jgi:predicted DCC family thiol-disulfide oxidoreductase YuxK
MTKSSGPRDAQGEQLLLVYDQTCCFCRRSTQLITWLDRSGRIVPLAFDVASERFADIPAEGLEDGVRLRARDGEEQLAMHAVRGVMQRLPLLRPIAVLLRIPVVFRFATRAYDLVSRYRHDIPCR